MSTIRASYPTGLKIYIAPDAAVTPLVENVSTGELQIGTGVSPESISSSDSVMPITHTIAGVRTTTGTINLRAGIDPATGDADVDANGKRILSIELFNLGDSTNSINVAPGAADPYPFLGAGNDITINPGMSILILCHKDDGAAPADRPVVVSNTVKNIDVTISGTSTLKYEILLGD
jgi:hypothetical protein